jgi:hypothetical protein
MKKLLTDGISVLQRFYISSVWASCIDRLIALVHLSKYEIILYGRLPVDRTCIHVPVLDSVLCMRHQEQPWFTNFLDREFKVLPCM